MTPCFSRNPAKDWEIGEWVWLDPAAAPQGLPAGGRDSCDGALLRSPFLIGAEWEESGASPFRNPGTQLWLGGPWGLVDVSVLS